MRPANMDIEDLLRVTPGLERIAFRWNRISELMRGGLGSTEVVALLDTDSALRSWMQEPLPVYGLEPGALWRHSLTAAAAVDLARSHSRVPVPPSAFGAALLHDVGKRVLSSHLEDQEGALFSLFEGTRSMDVDRAEMELLRFGHADIGAHLARHWGLSEATVEGIRFHHAPILAPTAESRRVAAQVALGDAVAVRIGAGHGSVVPDSPFDASLAGILSISREGFEALCTAVERHFDEGLRTLAA